MVRRFFVHCLGHFVCREMSIFHTISNFEKLNFCNFSAHLPSLHNPIIFPFRGASYAAGITHQNPLRIP